MAAVLTEAALITETTELAQKVGNGATEVKDIVTEVTKLSETVLLELAGCGEKQASQEAVVLHDSLKDVEQHGEKLIKCCLKLKHHWDEFNSKIESILKSKTFEKADFADIIRRLHRMTKCAGKCMGEYQIFTDELSLALKICTSAMGHLKSTSVDRKANASTGRWVGYGAVATFVAGAVACGILTVATGGAAAPILVGAVAGAVAAGTAGMTYAATEKMENIGRQLQVSAEKLSSVQTKLKEAGDGIKGLQKVTEQMVKNLERALKLEMVRQSDKEQMEQKLLEKDNKIMELEAKLKALENP